MRDGHDQKTNVESLTKFLKDTVTSLFNMYQCYITVATVSDQLARQTGWFHM
jgi:hypothetical protein